MIGVGSTTPTTTTVTDETGQQTTEALPRTLMTLALDQKDAERVLFATSNGELAFGLLTPDSTVAPAKGVERRQLVLIHPAGFADRSSLAAPNSEGSRSCRSSSIQTAGRSRPCSRRLPANSHGVPSGDRLLRWLDEHPAEFVVVIGPGIGLEEALLLAEGLRVSRPALSLVLVRHQLDGRRR